MEEELDFEALTNNAVLLTLDDSVYETGICGDCSLQAAVKNIRELDGLVQGLDGEGHVARGETEGGETVVEPDIGGVVAQTKVDSQWQVGVD